MRLLKISYIDHHWSLENLELGKVNLIVGENSTGKSRTLATIDKACKIIKNNSLKWGGQWKLTFLNNEEEELIYEFATKAAGSISFEKITLGGKEVLYRGYDENGYLMTKLKNMKNKNGRRDIINPPKDKLTLQTNRDIQKYPYLEDIVNWAENSYGFKFGTTDPHVYPQEDNPLTAVEDIPLLIKSLNEQSISKIISQFNSIGYNIEKLSFVERFNSTIIYIKESGVEKTIPHFELSQGMFRSLALIIFVEYLISNKKTTTLAIDDLCEGVDYARAVELGRLIFRTCRDINIQLIATSNDSFLMNMVPIEYWNILQRNGQVVRALNINNSRSLFEEFSYTGLSNFDFFSSDYILQATRK